MGLICIHKDLYRKFTDLECKCIKAVGDVEMFANPLKFATFARVLSTTVMNE